MSVIISFYKTTVGKKIAMALSGLIMVGFVIGHMVGNLKLFLGFDPVHGAYALDLYGEHLRTFMAEFMGRAGFLWIVRIVLVLALILHVMSGIQLSILNRKAKPIAPTSPAYKSANAASRTMLYGGLFLLTFIIFHILHMTTGTLHYRGFEEGHVYANLFFGFQSKPVAIFYVASMLFLALHLYHGAWSMFQTLGVDSPAWNFGTRTFAKILSITLFIGFSAVPVSIAFKLVAPPMVTQLASHP